MSQTPWNMKMSNSTPTTTPMMWKTLMLEEKLCTTINITSWLKHWRWKTPKRKRNWRSPVSISWWTSNFDTQNFGWSETRGNENLNPITIKKGKTLKNLFIFRMTIWKFLLIILKWQFFNPRTTLQSLNLGLTNMLSKNSLIWWSSVWGDIENNVAFVQPAWVPNSVHYTKYFHEKKLMRTDWYETKEKKLGIFPEAYKTKTLPRNKEFLVQ